MAATCRDHTDCPDGPWPESRFCDGSVDPARCAPGCDASDCPEGQPCRPLDHVCGCRNGLDCVGALEGMVCEPPACRERCQDDTSCADGWGDTPDGFEEPLRNGGPGAATPAGDGVHEQLTRCAGDEDWFSVELGAGDELTAQTDREDGVGCP